MPKDIEAELVKRNQAYDNYTEHKVGGGGVLECRKDEELVGRK